MSFESKLRKLRENKNLTQEELAKLVGVSLKTISRYEMGESKPRYRKIYDKLAEVLGTSHDYLVTDEENFILDAREKYGYIHIIPWKFARVRFRINRYFFIVNNY